MPVVASIDLVIPVSGVAADASAPVEAQTTFDLQLTEVCVRYWLHMDAAPGGISVVINGYAVGSTVESQPFAVDVTDAVRLEDNTIILRGASLPGRIRLQAVPCSDE